MRRVSSSVNRFPVLGLPWPAWRIGWGRNLRRRWRRARICGNFGGRRLRQSYTHIHFQMVLRTVRTKGLAGVFVAEAGQFVAAVDTVAISCDGGGLNGHQSHCVCPLRQDSTWASRFGYWANSVLLSLLLTESLFQGEKWSGLSRFSMPGRFQRPARSVFYAVKTA